MSFSESDHTVATPSGNDNPDETIADVYIEYFAKAYPEMEPEKRERLALSSEAYWLEKSDEDPKTITAELKRRFGVTVKPSEG